MANDKIFITDLPVISEIDDNTTFVSDNGSETNSVKASQLKDFVIGGINLDELGSVKSVNDKFPDENGNIELTADDIGVTPGGGGGEGDETNPNLLDNWYFLNPVNRNGFTTGPGYNGTAAVTIDRWRRVGYTNGVITLGTDGIVIDSTATTSGANRLRQLLAETLPNNTYTFSILVTEISGTLTVALADKDAGSLGSNTFSTTGVHTMSYTGDKLNMVYWGASAESVVKVVAVKLEVGSVQTLAHQENDVWVLNKTPDFIEQMIVCSQYNATTDELLNANLYTEKGGTVTGNLTIKKIAPEIIMLHTSNNRYINMFMGSDGVAYLRNAIDGNNRSALFLQSETITDFNRVLRLQKTVNGSTSYYNIFGEHNKPLGTYYGSGESTERTVNVGGIGNVLVISSSNGMAWVTEGGAMVKSATSTSLTSLNASSVKFVAGVLTLKTTSAYVNSDSVQYSYQLV